MRSSKVSLSYESTRPLTKTEPESTKVPRSAFPRVCHMGGTFLCRDSGLGLNEFGKCCSCSTVRMHSSISRVLSSPAKSSHVLNLTKNFPKRSDTDVFHWLASPSFRTGFGQCCPPVSTCKCPRQQPQQRSQPFLTRKTVCRSCQPSSHPKPWNLSRWPTRHHKIGTTYP